MHQLLAVWRSSLQSHSPMLSWQKSEGRRPPLHDEEYTCLQSLQLLNQVRDTGRCSQGWLPGHQSGPCNCEFAYGLAGGDGTPRPSFQGSVLDRQLVSVRLHDDDLVIVSTTVYGTQDAPRGWYKNLDGTLLKKGLRRVRPGVDSC